MGGTHSLHEASLETLLARLDADLARKEADPAAQRDDAAWAELRRRVKRFARICARKPFPKMVAPLSKMELDDVVQDACIKLQNRDVLSKVRRAAKPDGYLCRMVRNVAADHLRGGSHRLVGWHENAETLLRAMVPPSAFQGDRAADFLPSSGWKDESKKGRAFQRALEQLSTEDRDLYVARYRWKRPAADIAVTLKVSTSAIYGRLRRLRERLRVMTEGPNMRKRNTRKRNVDMERLRAAYQANGTSWNQLARKAGVSHPTLSRLGTARGRTRAVRVATLERLAAALQVPAEWLTGERSDLPYVPERLPWAQGAEGPSLWERPTADYVRWSWLMQRVEKALRRNLDAWYGEKARDAYDSWGHGVVVAFAKLARSIVWRSAALEPVREETWSGLWQCDDGPSLTWLMHVLEPWFADKAYLNAEVLRAVLEALRASPEVQLLGSEPSDKDAVRGLQQYAAARREFAPDEGQFEGLGPEEP